MAKFQNGLCSSTVLQTYKRANYTYMIEPPVQTSRKMGTYVIPVLQFPGEFSINGAGQDYIDVEKPQLYARAQIIRANNEQDYDHIGPINLILYIVFFLSWHHLSQHPVAHICTTATGKLFSVMVMQPKDCNWHWLCITRIMQIISNMQSSWQQCWKYRI